MYESKYINEKSPIKFGFNSIFYRVNAWPRFRRITLLIRKFTTAFETLEHWQNLDLVSSQIKRVTKPNGLVLVSVPTTDLNGTYVDRSHIWHKSLVAWLHFFWQYFEVLSVSYFMKFMKYLDGKTCNTFIAMRNNEGTETIA